MKFNTIFFIFIFFVSCKKETTIDKTKALPFYNSAAFTPEWIAESDDSYATIHTIAPFQFTNQNSQNITNKDFRGKIYIADFFFTTCPTICPKMNKNLVDIQNTFPDRPDFGIASFTINPEYDTQTVLKAYAENYGVTNPNWHFMTGEKEAIYNLANIGFNLYAAQVDGAEGGFEHSGNFALIDKEGYIRSRTDAFGNPKIYYKGVISQAEQFDADGESEDISALKEDILKLLENE